jgi:hypothetical protein
MIRNYFKNRWGWNADQLSLTPKTRTMDLGDVVVDVVWKDIKNLHLSVRPPGGKVRITVPVRMKLETIRAFALSKLDWIKKHKKKMREQERENPREEGGPETHLVWGQPYGVKLNVVKTRPSVELKDGQLVLNVKAGFSQSRQRALLEAWYRDQVKTAAQPMLAKWEPQLGVRAQRLFIQRMKTRWGTCHYRKGHIRLNSDLARKPLPCLEYVVVHELVHLLEPSHNTRFKALMTRYMPEWKQVRNELKWLPVRREK